MLKDRIKGKYNIQLGIIGLLTGGYYGISFYKPSAASAGVGALLGLVLLGILLGSYYNRQAEPMQTRLKFGVPGVIFGILVGGAQLKNTGHEGIAYAGGCVAGAIVGLMIFGILIAGFINIMKQKDKYLSFKREQLWLFFMGLLATVIGQYLTYFTIHKFIPEDLPYRGGLIVTCGIFLTIFFWMFFMLPLGFIFSSNRYRPVYGGLMVLFAGLMVTWIGINLSPILFAPNSGLYWSGLVIGLLLCSVAIFAIIYPKAHAPLGAVSIILSILSLLGAAGGLIIGCISGIIGGSLVLAWAGLIDKEGPAAPQEIPSTPQVQA